MNNKYAQQELESERSQEKILQDIENAINSLQRSISSLENAVKSGNTLLSAIKYDISRIYSYGIKIKK